MATACASALRSHGLLGSRANPSSTNAAATPTTASFRFPLLRGLVQGEEGGYYCSENCRLIRRGSTPTHRSMMAQRRSTTSSLTSFELIDGSTPRAGRLVRRAPSRDDFKASERAIQTSVLV